MIFNSIIPLPYYNPIFYNTILVLVLLAVFNLFVKGYVIHNPSKKEYASFPLLLGVIFYIGLRPLSVVFGDMGVYHYEFLSYSKGAEIIIRKDILWQLFVKFCSGIMTVSSFFLLCTFLYIFPLYSACKKWFGANKYIPFLMLIASFSFLSYGTNGIRNGIATSLFIFAISRNKNSLKYGIMFLAFLIHASLIIPVAAFVLTLFYKNSRSYLFGWLGAIPLSIVLGSFWENLFASLGFRDERLRYLTGGNFNNDSFAYMGFRYDFVLYSAAAVFAGYYYIIKKKIKDKIYIQLFNIYLVANAFWILIIRANFSNRFAYLSWFLMAFVIFYPFLKQRFFKEQQKVLALVIMIYFGFTYLMFLKN